MPQRFCQLKIHQFQPAHWTKIDNRKYTSDKAANLELKGRSLPTNPINWPETAYIGREGNRYVSDQRKDLTTPGLATTRCHRRSRHHPRCNGGAWPDRTRADKSSVPGPRALRLHTHWSCGSLCTHSWGGYCWPYLSLRVGEGGLSLPDFGSS